MKQKKTTIKELVSTIIPVYNRPDMLKQAVQSVLDQTYRPIEIIIVNDGSTDGTQEIAEQLSKNFPNKISVINIRHSGAGPAREAGRIEAQGEFIQYLDSDDLLLPEKFEVQIAALNERPDCGIAYGNTGLVDINGKTLTAPYKWTNRNYDMLFPALLVDRWWNTHTPLFRKEVCDAVGPWSDMIMAEDWEYEARIAALNIKLVYCPQYLSNTTQHDGRRIAGKGMTSEIMRDFGRLIEVLYGCALRSKICMDTPEMKHFSRWAFFIARQTGQFGFGNQARLCLDIAYQTTQSKWDRGEIRLYSGASKILGWKITYFLSKIITPLFHGRGSPGESTMKQSWMPAEKLIDTK